MIQNFVFIFPRKLFFPSAAIRIRPVNCNVSSRVLNCDKPNTKKQNLQKHLSAVKKCCILNLFILSLYNKIKIDNRSSKFVELTKANLWTAEWSVGCEEGFHKDRGGVHVVGEALHQLDQRCALVHSLQLLILYHTTDLLYIVHFDHIHRILQLQMFQ